MELWRSILEKVHARSQLSVGLFEQLPNYPSINHVNFLNSHPCPSFLSSYLSALPSPCCYKHNTTQLSPVYHHNQQNQQNPFQHLIIQTQNQQNQTKNNSKSTQNNLKSTQNQTQTKNQLKINLKSTPNQKSTQNPQKINSKLNHQLKTHNPNPKSKSNTNPMVAET